jgi:hypothetical protein
MLENIKLLTSRRAYEFRPDDLRLTMVSTKPVQEQIQQLFHFQTAMMGSPIATFGDVPPTYPPGMVFDMGVWVSPEEQLVPIRFLHFEQRRIVIDVAGPSSAITAIFEQIQQFLSQLTVSDGSPVIGTPSSILEYSEITAHFPYPTDAMFVRPVRDLLAKFKHNTNRNSNDIDQMFIPTFVVQTSPGNQEVSILSKINDPHVFTLTLRPGTRPDERIYFSGAPLDSETHLDYLTQLESSLSTSD